MPDTSKCPICNNNAKRIWHKYVSHGIVYKPYRCNLCDLEFWYPRHVDKDVYEDSYEGFYDAFHNGTNKLASWCQWFLYGYPGNGNGKKLLDVGCGSGEFLQAAARNGFSLWGIDIDAKSTMIAKTKIDGNVYNNSLEEIHTQSILNGSSFDVITSFEVLEHQDDPRLFLQDINYFLKPNGYFFGSVPNRSRLLANIDRFVTKGDLPPHHFLWWNIKSLKYALQSNGFVDVQIYTAEKLSVINLIGLLQDLFIPKRRTQAIKKTILQSNSQHNLLLNRLKNTRNFFLYPIVLPLYFLQYMFCNKEKELYFSAQKLNH